MIESPSWHGLQDNPYNPHAWIVGKPRIADDVWIGAFCVIDGSGGLDIGRGCDISAGAQIYTHSTVRRAVSAGRFPIERRATSIGDYCHVGAGAVILMGCTIGAHSIIGAGAVVLEGTSAPAHSLVVGNPARVLPGRARQSLASAIADESD